MALLLQQMLGGLEAMAVAVVAVAVTQILLRAVTALQLFAFISEK
jgi:hypothetical protein